MYKALTEIGGYKPGEVVPDEKAEVWAKMYAVSPVEKVAGAAPVSKSLEKEDSEIMSEDYLNRPPMVVKKNIETDKLSKSALKNLLKDEKADKNRKVVVDAIEKRLEGN